MTMDPDRYRALSGITIDLGPGVLDPLTPRPEHDRPQDRWPTATLAEVRPTARVGALFRPAPNSQCWILEEPFRGADVLVVGPVELAEHARALGVVAPSGINAWPATAAGVVETAAVAWSDIEIPTPLAVWPVGTDADAALASIGYTAVR